MNRKNNRFIRLTLAFLIIALICSSATLLVANAQTLSNEKSAEFRNPLSLTEEEQTYISNHKNITIVGDASWIPLEYKDEETGEYSGVIAQILAKFEEYTGFNIECKIMDNYSEALNQVSLGKFDFSSGLANDSKMADEYNVKLSEPYLTINSAVVSKSDYEGLYTSLNQKTIAVVKGDYANESIKNEINNATLVECSSNEECLQKVKDGETDMAIIASYCAEYYMSIPKFSTLKSHTISDFSWQLSFGFNKNQDQTMIDIFNKAIDRIEHLDINEAVYQGIIGATYDNDIMIFFYKHPIMISAVSFGILLVIAILIMIIFITKKHDILHQKEDATRLRLALERTTLCIWELDIHTKKITKIDNENEKHGFGDFRENIPESVISSGNIHPHDVPLVQEALRRVENGEQNVQGCWRVKERTAKTNDTLYWWEQVLFHIIYDERHRPLRAIGVSEDVTKEKNAQKDSLTMVYNRLSFEQKANTILNERRNSYLECAFLILDLDGFKQINDTYGHAMGDKVLISVGSVLNKTFRSTDIIGRLGGDEFTVFMTSISKREDAMRKANELVENINKMQDKFEYEFPISCSVGVAVAKKGEESFEVLYKKADSALYEAKHAGKNQYKIYE